MVLIKDLEKCILDFKNNCYISLHVHLTWKYVGKLSLFGCTKYCFTLSRRVRSDRLANSNFQGKMDGRYKGTDRVRMKCGGREQEERGSWKCVSHEQFT